MKYNRKRLSRIAAVFFYGVLMVLGTFQNSQARNFRVSMLPQPDGDKFNCLTCHIGSGGGPRNPFGLAVQAVVTPNGRQEFWSAVFDLDSDGDGVTNGRELGDADGDGIQDPGITAADIYDPSNPDSTPPPPTPPFVPAEPAPLPVPAMPQPIELSASAVPAGMQPGEGPPLVDLAWSGGLSPWLVEVSPDVGMPSWSPFRVTSDSNLSVPAPGPAGFFQVRSVTGFPPALFTAEISGAMERPEPVETDGRGSGNFRLHGNVLDFEIHYTGLSGPATAAHIHGPANTTETGGVLINLQPFHIGPFDTAGVFKGSVEVTPEQKAAILMGHTYVNIHTENHGPGEIRGQVAPVFMEVRMAGANARPNPVNTSGLGGGFLTLVGNQLNVHASYWDLTGPATAAHIHGPAGPDQTAGVLVGLEDIHQGPFGEKGTFRGSLTLSPEQLGVIIDGCGYINVHTAANGPGEIRGQVLAAHGATPLSAALSGEAEKPEPVTTEASGFILASLRGEMLMVHGEYDGLSGPATGAHIHGPASSMETAGVLVNLQPIHVGPFGESGRFMGMVRLTPEQRDVILSGRTYVNVHTAANGPGEIRGQLTQVLHWTELSGEAERPDPILTMASGNTVASLIATDISFNILYSGLSGTATAAHIHGAAGPEDTAGPVLNLREFAGNGFGSMGRMAGGTELPVGQVGAIADGLTYINIHTEANGPGEIRGQVLPADHPQMVFTTSLSGGAARPEPVITDGTGTGTLTLIGHTLHFNMAYSGLSGPATAAHIHGPATSEGTGGVLINLEPFNGDGFGTEGTVNGSVDLTPEQRIRLIQGATYVNFHTAANPAGEIRGQIGLVPHTIGLSGDAARPEAVETDGTGYGRARLVFDEVMLHLQYSGLSGTASAAHIHGAAGTEETAGVLLNLEPLNGGGFGTSGVFEGVAEVDPLTRGSIIDARTYINIHTPANPSGEIRGQVTSHPVPPRPFSAPLDGSQQSPNPVGTDASGNGTFTLAGDVLYFAIEYSGLSGPATAAHIHGPAEPGTNAGILIDLEPFNGEGFGESGMFHGAVALTPSQRDFLLRGLTYVNVHTAANPGGEIRGQLQP